MLLLVVGECDTTVVLFQVFKKLFEAVIFRRGGRELAASGFVTIKCSGRATRRFFLIKQDSSFSVPANRNILSLGMAEWRSVILFCSSDALLFAANGFLLDLLAVFENTLP